MGVAAAEHALLLQQLVFDGCIGAFDGEICRRPYHRNCGCALHRSSSDATCRRGGSRKAVSFRTRVASAGSISADGGKAKAAAEHVAKQRASSSSLMDQCVKLIDQW
ncbi:uncharacterized protein LOC141845206 [Curcuma longa]|uniref:uncharacterized protein LOC141845206 n=1 Tax=Curcuma longa TaxID=136217 RepID=UPI003D9F8904